MRIRRIACDAGKLRGAGDCAPPAILCAASSLLCLTSTFALSLAGQATLRVVSKKYTLKAKFWHEFRVIPLENAGREGSSREGSLVTWGFLVQGCSNSTASPRLGAFPLGYLGFCARIFRWTCTLLGYLVICAAPRKRSRDTNFRHTTPGCALQRAARFRATAFPLVAITRFAGCSV